MLTETPHSRQGWSTFRPLQATIWTCFN